MVTVGTQAIDSRTSQAFVFGSARILRPATESVLVVATAGRFASALSKRLSLGADVTSTQDRGSYFSPVVGMTPGRPQSTQAYGAGGTTLEFGSSKLNLAAVSPGTTSQTTGQFVAPSIKGLSLGVDTTDYSAYGARYAAVAGMTPGTPLSQLARNTNGDPWTFGSTKKSSLTATLGITPLVVNGQFVIPQNKRLSLGADTTSYAALAQVFGTVVGLVPGRPQFISVDLSLVGPPACSGVSNNTSQLKFFWG